MSHEFSRTERMIGKKALEELKRSKIAVYGIGGVGSFVVEGLVRAGIGHFVLVDDDLVCQTNINRQLHATVNTIGRAKVEVMKERILSINPEAEVAAVRRIYMPGLANQIIQGDEDYIVDAIDTVTAKIDLIMNAKKLGIPVISAMGAGNKMDPTRFEIADIYSTSVCPLCRVMRRELKHRGVASLKVVYSTEKPIKPVDMEEECIGSVDTDRNIMEKQRIPGSISFVPSVAGLIIAGEVVRDLIHKRK